MISDLTNHVFLGITTPGPPASEGMPLGYATHTTHRAMTYQLQRCGQDLHLWHGDWLQGQFEIWQCGSAYVAIARMPAQSGTR